MAKKDDQLVKVNIDGTGITKGGKEVKTKFFKALSRDLDDYSNISFTPKQALRINNHISKLQTGSTAIVPLICVGEGTGEENSVSCPFKDRCPLIEMKKTPVGKACLLEVEMLKHWILQYMTEYTVDPENFTEVGYCNELAEIEIYLWRLNNNLAKPTNAQLVVDQPVGTDRSGNPILQKALSPFMELKDRLQNRKSKIIKLMVGDRQERYKKEAALKQKEDKDLSSTQANLRRKIDSLKREVDTLAVKESQSLPSAAGERSNKVLTPDVLIEADEDE